MNFLLILLCLAAGVLLRRFGSLPANTHLGLNAWLIWVAIPAAALLYIPKISWRADMVWPFLMPLVVWVGSWLLLGKVASKWLDKPTKGALLLSGGLGNTSFVGFPLTLAYFGEAGLETAVICDQVTFLLLATLGVLTGLRHGSGSNPPAPLWKGVLRFPPFLAFLLALAWPKGIGFGTLPVLWESLALTIAPIALFSIGLQLKIPTGGDTNEGDRITAPLGLIPGLVYKLLLAPALVFGLLYLCGADGLVAKVTVFEAAMAGMATSSVLAVEYRLNANLSNWLIGLGVPISLFTTHLWWWLLERCF